MVCPQETTQTPEHLYRKFFECFNQGLFFEAHEFLEALWLPVRQSADGPFYKGLIQIAGAFVHMQKRRPRPAAALLRLARTNLTAYGPCHRGVDVGKVLTLTDDWLSELESGRNPLYSNGLPKLDLPTEPS